MCSTLNAVNTVVGIKIKENKNRKFVLPKKTVDDLPFLSKTVISNMPNNIKGPAK